MWAPRTVEARTTPGPAVPRYANAVIGIFREGGFSVALAHHALHILGSRMLGSRKIFSMIPRSRPAQERLIGSGLSPAGVGLAAERAATSRERILSSAPAVPLPAVVMQTFARRS